MCQRGPPEWGGGVEGYRGRNTASPTPTVTQESQRGQRSACGGSRGAPGEETHRLRLTYDTANRANRLLDKGCSPEFPEQASDAIREGRTASVRALVEGRYDLVPHP